MRADHLTAAWRSPGHYFGSRVEEAPQQLGDEDRGSWTRRDACELHREIGYLAGTLEALLWSAPEARQTKACHASRIRATEESNREAVRRLVGKYLDKNPDATRTEIYKYACTPVSGEGSQTKPSTIRKYAEDLLPPSRTRQARK